MTGFFRLALIAMLLAGIAGVAAILTMQFAVHGAVVEVPDLQGLPVEAAAARAAAAGLDLSVTQRFYSTALPAGRVLMQSPAASSSVRRGWNLAVAESLGPQRLTIPNVLGRNERDAILLVRQRGLELGAIAHLPDARVPAGTVLAQDPGPEAKGAAQPSVSLLVAAPEATETSAWVMPDEQGRPYAEAAAPLERAGLHVASVAGAPPGAQITLSAQTAPGTVLGQTPPAGSRVDTATLITLWVAGDTPNTATVPPAHPH